MIAAQRSTAGYILAAALALVGTGRVGAQSGDAPSDPRTVIHAGALLAKPGSAPVSDVSIIVENGLILEVRAGFVTAEELGEGADVEIVDLRASFVMPGLIDAHTHVTSEYSPSVRLDRLQSTDADNALRGSVYAMRTLLAGFTTIRNVGSSGDAAFALRDAINQGLIPGPRILLAGESITPTGGHSDATLGYREGLFDVPDAIDGICDGPAACRRAVRSQVKRGADLIKLTATGGVLSNTAAGTEQQFFADELEAIVATGHLLGRKVAAHAHGTRGINAALRAGVDSIEHGTYLDDESIQLFRKTRAFLVPTVLAGKTVEERARIAGYFPPSVAKKALEIGPLLQAALARAHKGGVRIAFGTDSGVSEHGENGREFALMVDAGMNEMEVLAAATINAAQLLGLDDEIGLVEAGWTADLIATDRNPLIDITELQRVRFVMKGGEIHKR